jgi:hypothetical protein
VRGTWAGAPGGQNSLSGRPRGLVDIAPDVQVPRSSVQNANSTARIQRVLGTTVCRRRRQGLLECGGKICSVPSRATRLVVDDVNETTV